MLRPPPWLRPTTALTWPRPMLASAARGPIAPSEAFLARRSGAGLATPDRVKRSWVDERLHRDELIGRVLVQGHEAIVAGGGRGDASVPSGDPRPSRGKPRRVGLPDRGKVEVVGSGRAPRDVDARVGRILATPKDRAGGSARSRRHGVPAGQEERVRWKLMSCSWSVWSSSPFRSPGSGACSIGSTTSEEASATGAGTCRATRNAVNSGCSA